MKQLKKITVITKQNCTKRTSCVRCQFGALNGPMSAFVLTLLGVASCHQLSISGLHLTGARNTIAGR